MSAPRTYPPPYPTRAAEGGQISFFQAGSDPCTMEAHLMDPKRGFRLQVLVGSSHGKVGMKAPPVELVLNGARQAIEFTLRDYCGVTDYRLDPDINLPPGSLVADAAAVPSHLAGFGLLLNPVVGELPSAASPGVDLSRDDLLALARDVAPPKPPK